LQRLIRRRRTEATATIATIAATAAAAAATVVEIAKQQVGFERTRRRAKETETLVEKEAAQRLRVEVCEIGQNRKSDNLSFRIRKTVRKYGQNECQQQNSHIAKQTLNAYTHTHTSTHTACR
jgi:hypothetical protein